MKKKRSIMELKNQINNKLFELNKRLGEQKVKLSAYFCVVESNSPEGTYIYLKDGEYHFSFFERGTVQVDKKTTCLNEITYWILDDEIFKYSMMVAMNNKKDNEDFRRQLFKKELELHSYLGYYFYYKKLKYINKILEDNPYLDKI